MAKTWTIQSQSEIDSLGKYEWHVPSNEQQHVKETVPPGDLKLKPEDVSLVLTLSPAETGVQSGHENWTIEPTVDSNWYVLGGIVQE